MENKELQSLIADLKAKLPGDMTVELIDDEQPGATAEPQSEPGEALTDAMVAMLINACNEVVDAQTSARDDDNETLDALADLVIPRLRPWYLLDKHGDPVPVGDTWTDHVKVERLLRNQKKRTVARTHLEFRGKPIEVSTVFLAFNHQHFDGPPILWETMIFVYDYGDSPVYKGLNERQWRYESKHDAKLGHRSVVKGVRCFLAALHRQRRPSPVRRAKAQKRIAAGQDVLRRRGYHG